ncbi:hypothetical protein EIZ62_05900 [Streptomyces ficellus]|uniref:Uncharacterized protein n=2 Tax=Streptomyces ficellus TaxID=1977088 RepID=A0A6I6FRR9_9ACTN|nr:hypothetical protein EIZ62_05900 [Streptomyces ficellus]
MGAGAIVAITLGSVVGVIVLLGIVGALAGSGSDTGRKDVTAVKSSTPDAKPAEQPAAAPEEQSQTDQFKAFVVKEGTAAEKAAAQHVTRVQGADEQNNVLDSAEIHTDYTGGLLGPHGGDGKLLASIFAEWKTSKNGLVTVYDGQGQILANGNF